MQYGERRLSTKVEEVISDPLPGAIAVVIEGLSNRIDWFRDRLTDTVYNECPIGQSGIQEYAERLERLKAELCEIKIDFESPPPPPLSSKRDDVLDAITALALEAWNSAGHDTTNIGDDTPVSNVIRRALKCIGHSEAASTSVTALKRAPRNYWTPVYLGQRGKGKCPKQ